MTLYRGSFKVNSVAEKNGIVNLQFCYAPYSTTEIVSLYRESRKVNRVAEVNWGCEFKICKARWSRSDLNVSRV